jgi:Arc/MetJ-type ribon-helix-helix transcriptional regulator
LEVRKMDDENLIGVMVRLPPEVVKKIDELRTKKIGAYSVQRSRSDVIRELIIKALAEVEVKTNA